MTKSINELFVELEAAYIKKAKYVKIINTMKHSNIPYWKSVQMAHPVYSLKQAEYEVKRWENVYHNKIVKHINTYISNKKDARVSLHSLATRGLIDLVVNNLKKVQQARRHLQYVQHIYKDYKVRLEDINYVIKDLKETIVHNLESPVPEMDNRNIAYRDEVEALNQTISDTYDCLESSSTPLTNVIKANPENSTIALFNIDAKEECTPITTTEPQKPKTYNSTGLEIKDGYIVDPDFGTI